MDVVKNEITSLGGRVEIASTPGRGTTFTITLPLTLAVTQAVMVRAGDHALRGALGDDRAGAGVQGASRYARPARRTARSRGRTTATRCARCCTLLGEHRHARRRARQIPVLLLKSGVQRAAIHVDEIVGNREIVVKTIGPQLARSPASPARPCSATAQVVLILNPVQLVASRARRSRRPCATAAGAARRRRRTRTGAPLVMVVDDSLTVRKITGRMLAREGYEVVDARRTASTRWSSCRTCVPDVILLDIEMPRMDGFELARNVRADDAPRSTSRSS